ncbi:hydrolase TatD [Candidatus Falkowbacteria bacterium]|nr:MAG: hydrolase TatD [Candidatus Falkowbacteria bacterium]
MFIDTHAHVNFSFFKNDADKVIQNALNENTWIINVGVDYKTSKRTLEYANKYEKGVFAAVGLHPMHLASIRAQGDDYDFTTRGEEFNYDIYEKLAKFEKAVAIGEVGLDYYHLENSEDINKQKDKQKHAFKLQLMLARRLDLPVIIHCRQAHDDLIDILSDFRKENIELIPKNKPWGVMHCFSGDEDLAWKYFSLGMLISFTGLITFSRQWDDLIRKLPHDKFMIETDCPFMTPEPYRGKRNEPILVKYVAKRIAEIKKLPLEKVAQITTENARKFFNI